MFVIVHVSEYMLCPPDLQNKSSNRSRRKSGLLHVNRSDRFEILAKSVGCAVSSGLLAKRVDSHDSVLIGVVDGYKYTAAIGIAIS